MSKGRRRAPPLSYGNKNEQTLVHKLKTLRAELTAEKQRSKLRLQLLGKLLKAGTVDEQMFEAIVRYVEGGGDFNTQPFLDTPDGDVVPGWRFREARDQNLYSTLITNAVHAVPAGYVVPRGGG